MVRSTGAGENRPILPKYLNEMCGDNFYFQPRLVSSGSESEEREHLHKWWLIVKAFFAHALQINVSPVFTAYLTLTNHTVRDICHVTGWQCRLLHPSQPIGREEMRATGSTEGLELTPLVPRVGSDGAESFLCKQLKNYVVYLSSWFLGYQWSILLYFTALRGKVSIITPNCTLCLGCKCYCS